MKKVFILSAFFITICSAAFSQSNTTTAPQQLLTEAQKNQLKEIIKTYNQKGQEIRNNQSLPEADKKNKLQVLRKEREEKMNAVLTAEQREKMKQQMTNRKGLSLSKEQQEKMKEINESFRKKLAGIKKDTTLTKEQQQEKISKLGQERKIK